jgi:hypothetical protein
MARWGRLWLWADRSVPRQRDWAEIDQTVSSRDPQRPAGPSAPGGHRAAAVYTLIETCKMNDVNSASLARCPAGSPPRSPRPQSRRPASLELEGQSTVQRPPLPPERFAVRISVMVSGDFTRW